MISARTSLDNLFAYCQRQNWIGYDPYDGLNSRIFQALPFLKKNRYVRLAFQQMNKRSIINFRPVLAIPKGRNPKGIGLFLSAASNLYRVYKNNVFLDLIEQYIGWLKEDSSLDYGGYCWGYNFDWQSRAFFLPKGTPTVVNTSFIGRALLSAYDITKDDDYLKIARSACDFILTDLNRLESGKTFCFSYSPIDRYFVHNATALASSLLAMVYRITGEERLALEAKRSLQYVVDFQKDDGSWSYGEDSVAQKTGTDNFHTGFILESLKIYSDSIKDRDFVPHMKKGLDFYQRNFFHKNGAPKYFYDKTFPIDIHCASQAIITLLQLKDYGADNELCNNVMSWMITNMQAKKGYFYYQKWKYWTSKIPYIRWAQAWACHALATYIVCNDN
jgi:rhamnogalacturonyl hydrolase YesR